MSDHMHDEDEHALQCVEDGEDPCKDNAILVDDEQTEYPRQTQQWQEDEGGFHSTPTELKMTIVNDTKVYFDNGLKCPLIKTTFQHPPYNQQR